MPEITDAEFWQLTGSEPRQTVRLDDLVSRTERDFVLPALVSSDGIVIEGKFPAGVRREVSRREGMFLKEIPALITR